MISFELSRDLGVLVLEKYWDGVYGKWFGGG